MRDAVGQPDYHNRGQHIRFRQQHVLRRHHDLLRVEAKLHGGLLHRVDRSAVHIGLAGFAQPPVTGRNAKAFQQAFQRGGAAVHCGRLYYLGNEETPADFHAALNGGFTCHMQDPGIGGCY